MPRGSLLVDVMRIEFEGLQLSSQLPPHHTAEPLHAADAPLALSLHIVKSIERPHAQARRRARAQCGPLHVHARGCTARSKARGYDARMAFAHRSAARARVLAQVPVVAFRARFGPNGLRLDASLSQSELIWRIWRENIAVRPARKHTRVACSHNRAHGTLRAAMHTL